MSGATLIRDILDGLIIGVRACAASLAFLLVIRSLNDRIIQRFGCRNVLPVLRFTDTFVIPVRSALPDTLKREGIDFSPLLSAVIILVFGFGITSLLTMLQVWIITF